MTGSKVGETKGWSGCVCEGIPLQMRSKVTSGLSYNHTLAQRTAGVEVARPETQKRPMCYSRSEKAQLCVQSFGP
jgi:hypothetical protein